MRTFKNNLYPKVALVAYIFIVTFLFLSCEKDETDNMTISLFVDESLQPYFDSFEAEGLARGIAVDLADSKIEGYLVEIDGNDVVGQCSYSPDSDNIREINIDAAYWQTASDSEKEFVVFHELGHCFLEREHLDDQTNRGRCESMMHSGLGRCRFIYNASTRSAYLDELFGLE